MSVFEVMEWVTGIFQPQYTGHLKKKGKKFGNPIPSWNVKKALNHITTVSSKSSLLSSWITE